MKKCDKKGCTNDAAYTVHLSLRVHENHEPAISTPIVSLCEEHKDYATWEDFVEPNWQKICQSVQSIGRVAPVKKFSKLILKPVSNEAQTKGGSLN